MGYLHVEVAAAQSPRRSGSACGDVVAVDRTASATTVVCADGQGSGIRAHVSAELVASRLLELLRLGFSLRKAFGALAESMNRSRGVDSSYTAFSVARILNDGEATVLSYEAPPPVFLAPGQAFLLGQQAEVVAHSLLAEAHCSLAVGEALLLVTDGITQAGLGTGRGEGWGSAGLVDFARGQVARGPVPADLAERVHRQARQLCPTGCGDDATAVLACCRAGQTVNVLTGPPSDRRRDSAVAGGFLASDGMKVVCGASTASLVARHLGKPVDVRHESGSLIAPPAYRLEGVDLVTEGAVTLNQVYNILEEDPARYEDTSGVTELCLLLRLADRVNFTVGVAANPANEHISFRQRGILSRAKIVPLLAERLRAAGKLVVVEYV